MGDNCLTNDRPSLLFICCCNMGKRNSITFDEYQAIKAHNDSLIDGAEVAIQNIRSIPARERSYMTKNMLLYWLDVVKSLKWSTSVAAQKAKVTLHGQG